MTALRLALVASLFAAGCGGSTAPPPPTTPASGASSKAGSKGTPKESPKATQEESLEAVAKALLDDAGKREKAQPDRPDLAMTAHHDVCVRHPFTDAGRRAAARCVELEAVLQAMIEREFGGPRGVADGLKKEGRFADAVAGLETYSASTTKETLKRRAAAQIKQIEDEARRVYVEAVLAGRKAVASGAYDEAVKLLKAASDRSTTEVRDAAEKDLVLLDRFRRAEESKRSKAAEEAALRQFGDRATRLLKRIKDRAYAEVIKDLDAAIADPALAACKDRLTADRAAVAAAASFWDAIQKTLKAKLNQEVVLRTAEGKLLRGTLKKINEPGTSLRFDPAVDVALDSLHTDQLLVLGINRDGLAEDAGASYAAAAMWFFLEGKHDVSRFELATASEMNAEVKLVEEAWRRGFFRATIGLPK